MIDAMSSCPTDETLRMLGDEGLDPWLFAAVEEHIKSCPPCRARLESIARECLTPAIDPTSPLPAVGEAPRIPGFEIREELGRGSMAVVYLAMDLRLGRLVALKVMAVGPEADPQARRRWRTEGKALCRVRHPNVVVLHDIGEVDSWFYLVLEYVPGRALTHRLERPVPRREAADLIARIAEAVHCIHEAGILHLDLKPGNILLDGEPGSPLDQVTPKVADFGISRLLSNSDRGDGTSPTAHDPCGGTPSYMAPEQISGTRDQLCPATDIHALGAILYKLLTGQHAFQGASPIETMDQVRHQEPVSPWRLNPKVPRDLETITLKCLEKNPSQRYASADALAEDLRRWLDGRPILARPISRAEHAWRACRRRPVIAMLGAVLAATVMISLGWILRLYAHAEAQRVLAEAARESAEKNREAAEQNLEIASTVIERLGGLVLDALYGSRPLEGDQLDKTASLLREQIARIRASRGFKPELLVSIGQINAQVAFRLHALGRLDEARDLLKERIDLLRECRERDPGNEDYVWETADALRQVGIIERDAGHPEAALDYFDRATSLVLDIASANPTRHQLASQFSNLYIQFSDRFAREGQPNQSKRARDGQLKILAVLETEVSGRPDLVLFKAAVLADHGEWDRARALVQSLSSGKHSIQAEPQWLRQAVEYGLEEWLMRKMRHWDAGDEACKVGNQALNREVEDILDLNNAYVALMGVRLSATHGAIGRMTDTLAGSAANYRKASKLEEADRLVSLLMAIGQRFVRSFPEDANSFWILSEAYMQRSKNAWKRKDLGAVKRELTQSLEAINRALVLDPNDATFRRMAADRKERLAGLPRT
jgi:eukaryotic-like serine/threonine-protein kinase